MNIRNGDVIGFEGVGSATVPSLLQRGEAVRLMQLAIQGAKLGERLPEQFPRVSRRRIQLFRDLRRRESFEVVKAQHLPLMGAESIEKTSDEDRPLQPIEIGDVRMIDQFIDAYAFDMLPAYAPTPVMAARVAGRRHQPCLQIVYSVGGREIRHQCLLQKRLRVNVRHYSPKRFSEALTIFAEITEHAERTGDRLTVAKCIHCAAQCARELGDVEAAQVLYPRALAHFRVLNVPSDANCARWGMALTLAAVGKTAFALSELYQVRTVFLTLGMDSHAASAALDVVRIKFDAGEDVRDLCAEIVPLLARAGLTQLAIEALAYIQRPAHYYGHERSQCG